MENTYRIILESDPDAPVVFEGTKDEVVTWLTTQPNVKGYAVKTDTSYYLTAALFFASVVNVAPKFYTMNPTTDDVLPDGGHLANGMKVLIEDSSERGRPEMIDEDWQRDRVMERNRWCTVTHLKVIGNSVSFIGVYDDGTKRRRSAAKNETAWIVKKESLKKSRVEDTQRYKDVYEIVKGALVANEEELGLGIDNVTKTATKKILGAFG